MSHPHRFYTPPVDPVPECVSLPEEEAHHALRVARLRTGAAVTLFDGTGREIQGVLHPTDKRHAEVRVTRVVCVERPRPAITLAVGGLHRDRPREDIVRRAAELGVARVCFWSAEHSQHPVSPDVRLLKAAVEACKQCGRSFVPQIDTANSLDALLGEYAGPCIYGARGAPPVPAHIIRDKDLLVVVGPEGDFSERETALLASWQAIPLSLGDQVYRSETAAILITTLVVHACGGLGPGIEVQSGVAP